MAPISYCLQSYLNRAPFHAGSVGNLQPCGKDLQALRGWRCKMPPFPFSAFPTGSFRGISQGDGYLLVSECHSTPPWSRWKPRLPEEVRLPTLIKLTLAAICYTAQYKTRLRWAMRALSEAHYNLTEHSTNPPLAPSQPYKNNAPCQLVTFSFLTFFLP